MAGIQQQNGGTTAVDKEQQLGSSSSSSSNNNKNSSGSREVEMRSDHEPEKSMDWERLQHRALNGWKENNFNGNAVDQLSEGAAGKDKSAVMIYRFNKPILKVESGTSLGVLKLLFESESRPGSQILGVRPKSSDGMPCIITLDESKLAEAQYDILISDKNGPATDRPQAQSGTPPTSISDKTATTRCLECSRESWKSKKFTSTGMNTEVSVNPSDDIDMRVFSSLNGTGHGGKAFNHISASSSCTFPPRVTRLRSTGNRQPLCPGVIGHTASVLSNGGSNGVGTMNGGLGPGRMELHNGSPSNGMMGSKPMTNGDVGDYSRVHDRSTPLSGDGPMYGRGSSYLREQGLHPDSGLYENGVHRRPSAFVDGRCRSPCPPSPSGQPRDVTMGGQRPTVKEEMSNDSNPTVYVLPNDFDIASGMEPQIVEYHHHRRTPTHHDRLSTPVLVKGECMDEHQDGLTPVVVVGGGGGYDLPTQVRIGELSPTRDGKLMNSGGGASPSRSSSMSPSSLNDDLGSPSSLDNNSGTVSRLLCKICQKVFPTKSMLYKHLRGHSSDEKPYKCQECGQGFTLSSNLRQHRIIHRGYKPFQCEFCGKKFMRSNVYKQHRRIHTGEEMHKCNLCPSEFLQKYALMKHMKKQHDIDCGENI